VRRLCTRLVAIDEIDASTAAKVRARPGGRQVAVPSACGLLADTSGDRRVMDGGELGTTVGAVRGRYSARRRDGEMSARPRSASGTRLILTGLALASGRDRPPDAGPTMPGPGRARGDWHSRRRAGDQGARAKVENRGAGTLGEAQKQPGGLPPHAATRVQHSPPVCVRQQHSTSTTFHRSASAGPTRQRAMPATRHADSADAIPWLAMCNANAITMVRSMAARLIARPPNARKPRLCAASRE
jgi:hypothetical protein